MFFDILIDTDSWYVRKHGEDHIEKQIAETLSGRLRNLTFLPYEKIPQGIQDLTNSSNNLLIGGSDQTIRLAAEKFMPYKKAFGVLPLGEKNLLATDFGIAQDFITALTQYWDAHEQHIDIARLNGEIFMREAVINADSGHDDTQIMLMSEHGSRLVSAKKVVISNNSFTRSPTHINEQIKRQSVICGNLAVYSVKTAGFIEKTKNLFKKMPAYSMDLMETKKVNVHLECGNSVPKLAIDGQPVPLSKDDDLSIMRFTVEPQALPVLIPARH